MPVSVKRDSFGASPPPAPKQALAPPQPPGARPLLLPQARVLAALAPDDPSQRPFDWPVVTRAQLAVIVGYTALSGSVTRALNGIRPGSNSGEAHPGLLALGYVECEVLDVEGVEEDNYRITAAGLRAYQAYLAERGSIPPVTREAASCANLYQGRGDNHRSKRKKLTSPSSEGAAPPL